MADPYVILASYDIKDEDEIVFHGQFIDKTFYPSEEVYTFRMKDYGWIMDTEKKLKINMLDSLLYSRESGRFFDEYIADNTITINEDQDYFMLVAIILYYKFMERDPDTRWVYIHCSEEAHDSLRNHILYSSGSSIKFPKSFKKYYDNFSWVGYHLTGGKSPSYYPDVIDILKRQIRKIEKKRNPK